MPEISAMRGILATLLCLWLLAPAGSALADQTDARLHTLFARLKFTTNAFEALNLENTIWKIWSETGDEEIDSLLQNGVTAMDAGDQKYALAAFNRIIELKPEFAEGWNKRATLYYLMGRLDESVQDIARTLELEPRHFGALSGLGLINASLGRYKVAIRAFEQALGVNPHLQGAEEHIKRLQEALRGKNL